jgi:hypothetical protein
VESSKEESCVKRIILCSDQNKRCQKHYNIFNYGKCSMDHFRPVPSTGKDGLCDGHRHGKVTKKMLRIGQVNDHGVSIISGPIKQPNFYAWELSCPYCQNKFIAPTTRFDKAKSCYNCRGLALRVVSEESTWKNHYLIVKGRNHSKEKGFDLTLEQFIEKSKQNCFYCNASPTPTKGYRPWSAYINTNGLDRIDSSMGYLYENVVPCCKYCNFAKSDRSVEDFKGWIKRLAAHQNLI